MGTTAQKLQAIQNSKAAIKSAIEAKGVSDVGDVLADYATKIGQISGGGGSTKFGMTIDSVFGDVDQNGALQFPSSSFSFASNDIVSIPANTLYYRFYNNTGITSVSLPNLTSCGTNGLQYAFYGCTNLTSINLPKLARIVNSGLRYAFQGCTSLTSVDLSNLTSVGNNGLQWAFRGCTSLTSVDLSKVTSVGHYGLSGAFEGCTSLTSADLSNLSSIDGNQVLQQVFYGCTSLTTVYLTKLSSAEGIVWPNAFKGCTALELVDFSQATAVPALSSLNTFQDTNNTFKIVVPDSLYDSWIVATNWSTYASQIVKASEYTLAS